jgi:ADP-ribosylglycohydrolase
MHNETKSQDIINRARGSLIGLAVGDALGVSLVIG